MSTHGRAGFVGGRVYAQNLQSGSISKTLGGTGTDTVAVVFDQVFAKVPKVIIERTTSDATTNYVSAKTISGFTLNIANSGSLTTTVTFDYIAVDTNYSE